MGESTTPILIPLHPQIHVLELLHQFWALCIVEHILLKGYFASRALFLSLPNPPCKRFFPDLACILHCISECHHHDT